MTRSSIILCLLIPVLFLACKENARTEQAETAHWNHRVVDGAHEILYKEKDTVNALRFYDSVLAAAGETAIYPEASRHVLKANYYYFFTPDNNSTLSEIDSALARYNTSSLQNRYPRTYVGLLLFGGHIAYRLSQYNKANDYYFSAKRLADRYLDPCERKSFNYSIAMVLYRQHNYVASLKHFEEAYAQQATCSPQTTANVLQQQEIQSNIGLCLVHLKQYDSALVHFDRALQIAEQNKDSLGSVFMDKIRGVLYGNRATVAAARNETAKAEALYLKSISLNDREGYEVGFALRMKLQLAELYYKIGNEQSMIEILRDGREMALQSEPEIKVEWAKLTAAYYEQQKQNDSALAYHKQYFTLKSRIDEEQEKLMEADVTRKLNQMEQEVQITKLKKDNHVAVIWLGVTVLFICMSIVIICLVYLNYKRSKKSLAESLALNEEIRKQKAAREEEEKQRHKLITEAVIQAQERERSLIGLELHDNINQVLTTVKLYNEMVMGGLGDPKEILARSSGYLQDCINEIRSLSKRLSAPTLGKISLQESVKDLVDSINSTSKIRITQHVSGLENMILNQDLHIGVYRILQEQLNNVLKHAEATDVLIELERNNDVLRLSITDNGKGFVVNGSKNGIGLMNMQTRASNLNGTFEMTSEPGEGCRVNVMMPCSEVGV